MEKLTQTEKVSGDKFEIFQFKSYEIILEGASKVKMKLVILKG